jgi:hypothetical protein
MKKLLLGLAGVLVVGGIAIFFWLQHQSLVQVRQENQDLRQQIESMAQTAAENNRLAEVAAQANPSQAKSSEQASELLRLRNEVTGLRRQMNELQNLRAENRQLRAHGQAPEAGTEKPPGITIARNQACINNLLTIRGAKTQWALEHRKAETDTPTDADLFGPTGYIEKRPECPAGGTYNLGAVGENPACTMANHVL